MIEADDAVDVGPAEVEDVGNDWDVVLGDPAKALDDRVEDRQQGSASPGESLGEFAYAARSLRIGGLGLGGSTAGTAPCSPLALHCRCLLETV